MQDTESLTNPTAPAGCSAAALITARAHGLSNLPSLLSAADELTACSDVHELLRLAVELPRERLGLERAGLYLRARVSDRVVLQGTWGTGADGKTTDERSLWHELGAHDCDALLEGRRSGGFGVLRAQAPLLASESGRSFVIGEGWIMATPLVAAGNLVGVLYNDSALSHAPLDPGKQAAAAAFCTLLAILLRAKRPALAPLPLPPNSSRSALVDRVLRALDQEISVSGDRLAGELGVSAGHLARTFKREMSMSLVEYRNQLRMQRFLTAVQKQTESPNLLETALEAGFGSYAQFHRIYRKLHGAAPRQMFQTGPAALED